MPSDDLKNRFRPSERKRILALDGGGVRGALTLSYLAKIEDLLAKRHGNDFRLSDYFDLIAGTSTGAIIASLLALGKPVAEIQELYQTLATQVFRRPWWRFGVIGPRFNSKSLEERLRETLSNTRLGDDELKTGLLVMAKRYDTTSPWPLVNNPQGKFYSQGPKIKWVANSNFELAKIVLASAAAPFYFPPQKIVVGHAEIDHKTVPEQGFFVDGGVTVHNNPALQAFMAATLSGFHFGAPETNVYGWPTGADRIFLVSIGTGRSDPMRKRKRLNVRHAIENLKSLIDDCSDHVETMLQWMSSSRTARKIDSEIGDLTDDLIAGRELLTYLRYNVEFTPGWMKDNLDKDYTKKFLRRLESLDQPKNVHDLKRVGEVAAEKQVQDSHFPTNFDRTG